MREDQFYLTSWKDEGDAEGCRLMLRGGADDDEDAFMAEFSRYPAPIGEQLAYAALKAANAYALANPERFDCFEEDVVAA
ncbi:hypothetical protein ASF24_15640 [Methylobacterium sp. Leaf86]|uniref:hypothetical protein n=1 Tax=Methylobacterium sp. Leaf86 TaxID=1736242 RepID=UPI0006F282E3|nr:hypothetical protein [Methylobacterium sp. Leaf86]KQO58071.1 hypothetical protein ASF24_15640 [Methylobacterium sp. Leaf86]